MLIQDSQSTQRCRKQLQFRRNDHTMTYSLYIKCIAFKQIAAQPTIVSSVSPAVERNVFNLCRSILRHKGRSNQLIERKVVTNGSINSDSCPV